MATNLTDLDRVPEAVRNHIISCIQRVDLLKEGKITYYQFLYVITEMRGFKNMNFISDQDIHNTKTCAQLGLDVEKIPLDVKFAANWVARIYLLRNEAQSDESFTSSGEFDDPWTEERRSALSSNSSDEPDPRRKDTYSETDWDVESYVNRWDLEKIVEEVFKGNMSLEGHLLTSNHESMSVRTDNTSNDEFTEEHFENFKKERRRKRDIVLGVLKTIVKQAPKPKQDISGNSEFMITVETPSDGCTTPTTPRSTGKLFNIFNKDKGNNNSVRGINTLFDVHNKAN
jgi:hypothetical protein